jgi:hypothetical protein
MEKDMEFAQSVQESFLSTYTLQHENVVFAAGRHVAQVLIYTDSITEPKNKKQEEFGMVQLKELFPTTKTPLRISSRHLKNISKPSSVMHRNSMI